MAQVTSSDRFADAVLMALRAEVSAIAEEEIIAAQERVALRMREKIASIALSVLAHYEVEQGRQFITIRVRNDKGTD